MVELLVPYLHQLRNTPYSKRIQHLLSLPTKEDDAPEGEGTEDEEDQQYSPIPLAGSGAVPNPMARYPFFSSSYILSQLFSHIIYRGHALPAGYLPHPMDPLGNPVELSPRVIQRPPTPNDHMDLNKASEFRYY